MKFTPTATGLQITASANLYETDPDGNRVDIGAIFDHKQDVPADVLPALLAGIDTHTMTRPANSFAVVTTDRASDPIMIVLESVVISGPAVAEFAEAARARIEEAAA